MFIRLWMTKNPITISPETDLSEAHQVFHKNNIRRLPVMRGKNLVGIVTLTDLQKLFIDASGGLTGADASHVKVKEIMTSNPVTANPNDPIEKAALFMYEHHISSLPILDGHKLVGIITETDIFKAFMRVMGLHEKGTRMLLELAHDSGAFQDILDAAVAHRVVVVSVVTLYSYSKEHYLAVLRIRGVHKDAFIEEIRKTGHRVLDIS